MRVFALQTTGWSYDPYRTTRTKAIGPRSPKGGTTSRTTPLKGLSESERWSCCPTGHPDRPESVREGRSQTNARMEFQSMNQEQLQFEVCMVDEPTSHTRALIVATVPRQRRTQPAPPLSENQRKAARRRLERYALEAHVDNTPWAEFFREHGTTMARLEAGCRLKYRRLYSDIVAIVVAGNGADDGRYPAGMMPWEVDDDE